MSLQSIPFGFQGGIDCRVRAGTDIGTFFDIVNFEPTVGRSNEWMTSPRFTVRTLSQGAYYDSTSRTEPTSSKVLGAATVYYLTTANTVVTSAYLLFTQYCLWQGATLGVLSQMKVYEQTAIPSTETLYTHCNIVINSITGLNLTLGNTLDIEIDAVNTFKWRKNGGAYTTGVAITTSGVAIDSGNVTVYFLASTGFNVTDAWSWRRTDAIAQTSGGTIGVSTDQIDYVLWRDKVYFINGSSGRVFVIESDGTNLYARSVGYRPVYGTRLVVFENHLVIAAWSKAKTGSTTATKVASTGLTIGWSDLNDLDCFWPTDVNEADSFTPVERQTDNLNASGFLCFGFAVIQSRLFLITNVGLFFTDYVGLPIVFSFRKSNIGSFPVFAGGNNDVLVVEGRDIIYLVANADVYSFDGTSLAMISGPVENLAASSSVNKTKLFYSAVYNAVRSTLYIRTLTTLICYNVERGVWFRRSAGFANSICSLFVDSSGNLYIGASNLAYYGEDVTGGGTPEKDVSTGGSFAPCALTTQMYVSGAWRNIKEITSVFVAVGRIITPGAGYADDATTTVKIYFQAKTDGNMNNLSLAAGSSKTLTTTVADGVLSLPRTSYRGLVLQLEIHTSDPTLPAYGVSPYAIEPLLDVDAPATR